MALDEHGMLVPPFSPPHVHAYGPVPVTPVSDPAEHNPEVGVVAENVPCAGPHAPLTDRLAEQLALVPPLMPLQFQLNGPVPETVVAVPVLQRPDVGATYTFDPLEGPQVP